MTYSAVSDVQAHLPFTLSTTSRPTQANVEAYISQAYAIITGFIGSAAADQQSRLKTLEVEKVLIMIDNYFRRGRHEPSISVMITPDDVIAFQLNDFVDAEVYGGGHYSVNIPP